MGTDGALVGAHDRTPVVGDALLLSSVASDGGCVQHSMGLVPVLNVGAGAAEGIPEWDGPVLGLEVGVGGVGAASALGAG